MIRYKLPRNSLTYGEVEHLIDNVEDDLIASLDQDIGSPEEIGESTNRLRPLSEMFNKETVQPNIESTGGISVKMSLLFPLDEFVVKYSSGVFLMFITPELWDEQQDEVSKQ